MASVGARDSARLLIDPIIEQADKLAERVRKELPSHQGLEIATHRLAESARKARRVAAAMKRPWSPHRLPVVFLAVAVVGFLGLLYWQLLHVSRLTLALPDRDAAELRARVKDDPRLDVRVVEVPGSREAAALLARGEVDLGFIQGGVPIPPGLLRLETPSHELVLFFARPSVTGPASVHRVLTSVEGEGSHSVGEAFFGAWGVSVTWLHAWKELTGSATWEVPADVDAVFVVKDPGDDKTLLGAERLAAQGFRLLSPPLGARAGRFDWLTSAQVPAGFLHADPPVPETSVATYGVTTWLVARDGLTPRLLSRADDMLHPRAGSIRDHSIRFDALAASDLAQGVDALFNILVNIALAFVALLGLDLFAYRKHLHELNSLVSVMSILQSSKDVLGVTGQERTENLLYLSLCSDALSLISTVGGYYTQENSSLLFANLSETVHQRCDALKLNIQLKVLHATVPV